jgi:hypothetical protein
MKQTKLERLSKVIEYSLDGMMKDSLLQFSHHVARYNRWMNEFDAEIIQNNMSVDTSNLDVSDFMRSVICNRINYFQNLQYRGTRRNKRF